MYNGGYINSGSSGGGGSGQQPPLYSSPYQEERLLNSHSPTFQMHHSLSQPHLPPFMPGQTGYQPQSPQIGSSPYHGYDGGGGFYEGAMHPQGGQQGQPQGYPEEEYYEDEGMWYEMRVEPEYPISNVQNTVTALRFDPWEELLWVGYQNGKVSSLVNPNLERYSSFYGALDKSDIRDILVDSDGVLALSKSRLSFFSRGGVPIYSVHNERMKDLNAVSFSKFDNSEIIVGNDHNYIFIIDFYTGKVIREIQMPAGINTLNRSADNQIWAGLGNGDISMLDQRTWRLEHSLSAHKGDIKSVDIQDDVLVSCGCSPRLGQFFIDPVIKVYDIKTLQPLQTIQYKRPTLIKFHPKYYSTIAICSDSTNQVYLCDLNQTSEQTQQQQQQYIQIDSLFGYLYSFDISSSGDIMVFGDQGGLVHQWTDKDDIRVNENSFPTELVQFPQFPRPPRMNENSALSEVPYNSEVSANPYPLSYWKPTLSYQVGLPQRPINSALLAHLKQHDFVGYITNTGINRKQIRGKSYEEGKLKSLAMNISSMSQMIRPPKMFRWIELKFKKFGIEEFDANEFNKTPYSGLENILPNTYTNSVIQTFYYIPHIRSAMMNHLCNKPYCLACELGFLFVMMDQSRIVDTSNFIRVLKQIPQASALGFILTPEQPESQIPMPQLISNMYRFLIEQLHKETGVPVLTASSTTMATITASQPGGGGNGGSSNSPSVAQPLDSIFERLFSSTSISSNKCINCGNQYEKQLKQFQYELSYPTAPGEYGPEPHLSFSTILKNTLSKQIKSPAWCEKCQGFFSTVQKKTTRSLPPILCINANCIKKEQEDYWKYESTNIIPGSKTFIPSASTSTNPFPPVPLAGSTPSSASSPAGSTPNSSSTPPVQSSEITWLPLKIRIRIDPDNQHQLSVFEYPNNMERSKQQYTQAELSEEENEQGQLYELVNCISHIKDQFKRIPKHGHLVSQIKMPDTKWILFNDFKINECTPTDVTHFDPNWRTPVILYYAKISTTSSSSLQEIPVLPYVNPITKETYLANNLITCKPSALSFTPATTLTMPKKDDIIAIDTEFVSIGPEETEISQDGKRVIIQPGNFSLARVSIVRTNGEAFIDDYIQSIEPVTDYLTRFSGINKGDLDPSVSTKNVITLKNCYLKLRYLVDLGVKFVGHGLKKDFRIINIFVPPEQIIDTVELFHLKNQRKFSLRFLAFVLLKTDIQTETHCSVEDARTAMELYKFYLNLIENSEFDETLRRIYDIGRQYNFKVPDQGANVVLSDVQNHINNILSSPISKPNQNNTNTTPITFSPNKK